MASFDDLERALRDDAAAHAPRASAIDLDAVTSAARARRRPRQWAVGTLSVVAVLGFGGLAVAAVTPAVMIAASESADLDAGATESESAPLAESDGGGERLDSVDLAELVACGAVTTLPETGTLDLALELRLPPTAPSDGSPIDTTAVLVNTSDTAVTVLTRSSVVGVLTLDGTVSGEVIVSGSAALDFELAPGEQGELPMRLSTNDCRGSVQEPLAPGVYGVTAVIDVLDPETGGWTLVVAPAVEIRLD